MNPFDLTGSTAVGTGVHDSGAVPVVLLASRASDCVHGVVLPVDGGRSAR